MAKKQKQTHVTTTASGIEYKLSEIEDKENIPPSFLLALDYPELLS